MAKPLQILSLGAGVQSSTVLLMSCVGELPRLDAAIFADTGWEPKAVYKHLDWLAGYASKSGIPVHRVTCGRNIRSDSVGAQVLGIKAHGQRWASMPLYTRAVYDQSNLPSLRAEVARRRKHGKPVTKYEEIIARVSQGETVEKLGQIKRQCTNEYKIQPIERFIKTGILGLSSRGRWPKSLAVEHWFGISADEIQRVRAPMTTKTVVERDLFGEYVPRKVPVPIAWKSHVYPLVGVTLIGRQRVRHAREPMTRGDCLAWLEGHSFPRPPRSACIGCPFHSDDEWRDLAPDEFEDACRVDEAIRNTGGMRGQVFLHRSCKPLREVDFQKLAQEPITYQIDGVAGNECFGMCGN